MARGRMIDKVIILSKKINAISEGAENLYYRIYVNTDDFGLFHADPKILKGQIYTLRSISVVTIERRLNELIEIGLVKIYESDGEKYLEIVGFEKHQTFRKDYVRKYEYPKPNTKSYELVRTRTKSPTNINKSNINKSKVIKEKANIEMLKKIIDYFNEITNQKRSYTCEEANKLINGRIAEGRTFKDFKHVIDTKTTLWQHDAKMRIFIRPSTLFRPGNFEDYLNEPYEDPRKKKIGQLGVSRGEKPKYPTSFLNSVYSTLQKQGKKSADYSKRLFGIDYYQAQQLAKKYKDSPAEFIKFLEGKK